MLKKYIEAGKIVGTHGIKGELRVKPWCDSAEFLTEFSRFYLNDSKTEVKVLSSRVHKNIVLLTLDGVDSVEKADVLRNRVLFISRDDVKLPKGRYFVQDLMGMEVFDADTFIYYGNLTDVMQTGANDVYQITAQDHKEYLIPAVPSVILELDFEKNKMLIQPMKGIFENED